MKIVTAGVIRDGATCRYLVALRGPGPWAGADKWEFPGGKVRVGESLEKCLARELEEELGIRACVGPLLGTVETSCVERGRFLIHFFSVTIEEGSPVAREHVELRWVEREALEDLALSPADRKFVHDHLEVG